ncbi:MAG: hypothetical protein LQ343_004251 [Gyalolechia ehrenbergii]|nr:MAG: hypothetical protein LQ343_004251 [Gyalolechia ehrenbergii]
MPVTLKPASHGAQIVPAGRAFQDSLDLLKQSCRRESEACKELLQSSLNPKEQGPIAPSSNGLVHGAIQAYSRHHCLHIRPEDVWFAILSQLSLYINAHAEELRGQFVAHEGKKELELRYVGNRYSFDFGIFAKQMGELIEQNVKDPEIRRWMLPAFTTTTKNDVVVASILLMGATQKYFDYKIEFLCGLPSVTLLGNKADWELILARLEKLKEYGEEPTQFYTLLRPVVLRFVQSFEAPSSKETIDFWQRIAHHHAHGSGSAYYSGWITAFCFWDRDGKSMYGPWMTSNTKSDYALQLDGAVYHWIRSGEVPPGYSSVPVKVDDNGYEFDATMIAGSVGMKHINNEGSGPDLDTIKPESGWWMFEKKS